MGEFKETGGLAMDYLQNLMEELVNTNGIPGYEQGVKQVVKKRLHHLSEEILTDRLGGLVGKKTGDANGPRILLAGHLDEIGFMVTQITDSGFLRFQPLGGWWSHNILSHRVVVQSRKGEYLGIIGSKPPHALKLEERRKVMDIKDIFIDIGAKSRSEAEEMGIRPGDGIVPVSDFFTMRSGEIWGGKALDNRAGCALAIEVLRQLQDEAHPNVVYGGATVQEEVGVRGAGILSELVRPDVAFALDVGVSYDIPGLEGNSGEAAMGDGPLMFILDHTMIPHTGLRNLVMDTAEELDIPLQVDALMGGGTDGAKFHLHGIGCPTVVIGFPVRYVHSHNSLMARSDFEEAARLLVAVIKKIDNTILDTWLK